MISLFVLKVDDLTIKRNMAINSTHIDCDDLTMKVDDLTMKRDVAIHFTFIAMISL